MANYTIIGDDGKPYGPVADYELEHWVRDGRVNTGTRVQLEGEKEWKTLAEIPEFAGRFPKPPILSDPPSPKPSMARIMAITSLVLGFLGLFTFGIAAVFGLALGIVSWIQIRKNGGQLQGAGLALAGIMVSTVVLVLILISSFAGRGSISMARQKSSADNCLNNEKQLAIAIRIYTARHHEHLPPATTWCDAIKDEVNSDQVFKCLASNPGSRCDYVFNVRLGGMDLTRVNPGTVMLFEGNGGWNANGGPESLLRRPRHARMINIAFADGSVQQLSPTQLGTLRWNP